jgi:hypothetical protein
MALMGALMQQVCSKVKPAIDPAQAQLVLMEGRSRKPVDLQLPFRLANIPTNAKLEVVLAGGCVRMPGAHAWCVCAHAACHARLLQCME